MDNLDYLILTCLKENSRMKASEISKRINLSVSCVLERIKKLEKDKTIEKYSLVLNQKKLGNDVTVLVDVTLEHPRYYDSFVKNILSNKNVVECSCVSGDFDFVIKIIASSTENLEKIHRKILALEGVKTTKTHFVFRTLKSDSAYLPEQI